MAGASNSSSKTGNLSKTTAISLVSPNNATPNLLPRSTKDFANSEYWENFFTDLQRSNEGRHFEWYGNYEELKLILGKYMKPKDNILVVGCGNSDLSPKLFYAGYRDQTNIDISSVVIEQMRFTYPRQIWQQMDVTNLSYADELFSCVLDKGTFDALAVVPTRDLVPEKKIVKTDKFNGVVVQQNGGGDSSSSSAVAAPSESDSEYMKLIELPESAKAVDMLKEVSRVVKPNGRFICVSLLQSHVAKLLLTFFHKQGWMIRVCKCPKVVEDDKDVAAYTVYMCVFTKMSVAGMPPVIEYSVSEDINAKPHRLDSIEQLLDVLADINRFAVMKRAIRKLGTFTEEYNCKLYDTDNVTVRYKVHIIDVPKYFRAPLAQQVGIFVIPKGRETDYMFGEPEGRMEMAVGQKFARFIFFELLRGVEYGSIKDIQNEVSTNARIFFPQSVLETGVSAPLPIMTSDYTCGERIVVYEGRSEFSEDFVVEDVTVTEGQTKKVTRRLIFLNAPNVIQSEVAMINKKKRRGGRSKSTNSSATAGTGSGLEPAPTILESPYHAVISVVYGLLKFVQRTEEKDTLIVGLGGGLLVSYLFKILPDLTITAIEIDQAIVDVAKNYFGLPEYGDGKQLQVVVEDGLKYLNELTEKKYSVIIFDVDNKNVSKGLSCPPQAFLDIKFLETTKDRLLPHGIFVLNLVCRSKVLKKSFIGDVAKVFPYIWHYDIPDDVNTICFCFKQFSHSIRSEKDLFEKAMHYHHSLTKTKKEARDEIVKYANEVGIIDMWKKLTIIRPSE